MSIKPWYKAITPREDLREGKPLDASEFAVHLDHIRDGRAPKDYQEGSRFFDRTYLTTSLTDLAAQTVRRLSGIVVETSAVFNMATQFGGGKTHALTALYHLATAGPDANDWRGVRTILQRAELSAVPRAATAVFVGTEFDALTGRGGKHGEPLRRTPWGEIAWQLGGETSFAVVAAHDEKGIPPKGDTIRALLPEGPSLILFDEVMNFVSSTRKSGLASQFYNFLQALSEEARARKNLVVVVSIPGSVLEMNPEDQRDYEALKKLLDRLGKPLMMSADTETAEIIRRRLFEWGGVPDDGRKTVAEYVDWVLEHRQLLGDVDADTARDRFLAAYPFHPAVLSVFERKWQSLPRFQKTRGILRLLALWVSRAYQDGYRGAHKDPLIGLGTAPLDDPYFRAAVFEQLGTSDLEGPVTTDICGKKEAHALRLDREATEAVKKARLHQKVATVILFESNGGQTKAEATVPEVRFAVAEPDLDIANVETALEALTTRCYYLSVDRNRYRFSLSPNLNKLLTDRRAGIQTQLIEERVREEVQEVFKTGPTVDRVYFPTKTGQVADRAALTVVVMSPDQTVTDVNTRSLVEQIIREHGASGRTFKSALLFSLVDGTGVLHEEARAAIAWRDIADDDETVKRLDESQRRQLDTSVRKALRDLREAVWRSYKHVLFFGKDNELRDIDLGLVHSSAAGSLVELIINRLRADDEVTDGVGPSKLAKYWPPALEAWSTRAARDAFFSSPALPRLINPLALKRTIADGVAQGLFAYAGKDKSGGYHPIHFQTSFSEADVEISDEMFLLKAEDARRYIEPPHLARVEIEPRTAQTSPGQGLAFTVACFDQHGLTYPCPTDMTWSATGGRIDPSGLFVAETIGAYTIRARIGASEGTARVDVAKSAPVPAPAGSKDLRWRGTVPPQKWMNFYTKVLSRFVATPGLKVEVEFVVPRGEGTTDAKTAEVKAALRELGLREDVNVNT